MSPTLKELYELVGKIPTGTVIGYGALGRCLSNPVSGVLIGKWMANCPTDLPWWRVIGADGSLKTNKRGPDIANEQESRLRAEGIEFENNCVKPEFFLKEPESILI